jgi:hypothetical protein
MDRKGKRLGRGTIIVLIAVLAIMLVVVLSSTALAGEKQYKFDPKKFDVSKFDHRIDWSQIGWSNIDFSKIHDWVAFWKNFDWSKFHWGHKCTTTTTSTTEKVTTTAVSDITTAVSDITSEVTVPGTANAIETGGGGTAGPGAGTWALGFFALALAGGLGWTAVRPALKRNK